MKIEEKKTITIKFDNGQLVETTENELLNLRDQLLEKYPIEQFKKRTDMCKNCSGTGMTSFEGNIDDECDICEGEGTVPARRRPASIPTPSNGTIK